MGLGGLTLSPTSRCGQPHRRLAPNGTSRTPPRPFTAFMRGKRQACQRGLFDIVNPCAAVGPIQLAVAAPTLSPPALNRVKRPARKPRPIFGPAFCCCGESYGRKNYSSSRVLCSTKWCTASTGPLSACSNLLWRSRTSEATLRVASHPG